jgi:predicted metalloprotease with PDZ domain
MLSFVPRALRASALSLLLGSLFVIPLRSAVAAPEHVAYTVTVADTVRHRFHVSVLADGIPPSAKTVSFAIPAWSPGWYVLTHAYRNISAVAGANAAGQRLSVAHPDRLTWRVATHGAASVSLAYDVIAQDRDPDALDLGLAAGHSYGFFAPYLDNANGFAPGPAMLMYVVDGKATPCSITYRVPSDWSIATSNDPTADPATFAAADYDTLADQPADLGHFRRYDRVIAGAPISVLIVGAEGVDPARWVDETFKIAASGIGFWGANARPPFPRYLFQFRFPPAEPGGGGLEHLNGTVITLDPSALGEAGANDMELVAHEFFHAWNVKRVRPQGLGPFDYTQPVRTKDLWWAEGVTDYFAPRIVVGAGLADSTFWRGFVGSQINDLQHNPARLAITLETASEKAWEGKSEGFGGLSYYNKGVVVGLLLDIEMRRRTHNRIGLDDLMKALVHDEAATGRALVPGEIERRATLLTGSDLSPFFKRVLRTTEELPYREILPAAGLKLDDQSTVYANLGFDIAEAAPGADFVSVLAVRVNGPAAAAGLREGDRISAINALTSVSEFSSRLTAIRPGDALELTIRRPGHGRMVSFRVGRREEHQYRLVAIPDPTPDQSAILASLIGAPVAATGPGPL